jgi:predicted kinase
MRKWMAERIKRRKKEPQEDKAQSAQAPLQPAYFDGEASPPASMGEAQQASQVQTDVERSKSGQPKSGNLGIADSRGLSDGEPLLPEAKPEEMPEERSGAPQLRRPNLDPRQGRRRRGRGGRGRSGSRSIPSQPVAGAASSGPAAAGEISDAAKSGTLGQAGATAGSAAMPRVPKGVVVLAMGLPGSGKSSWFKRHNIAPLSSDLLRSLLFDDPTEQRFQDLVFSNLRSMLKARLIARRPLNYVDTTNLTSHDRRGWIKLAQDYGYEVQAVFFDVPLDVCLERNRKRERVVSEDVMRRMASKQKPPTFEEGFAKITVVRVKQKEQDAG